MVAPRTSRRTSSATSTSWACSAGVRNPLPSPSGHAAPNPTTTRLWLRAMTDRRLRRAAGGRRRPVPLPLWPRAAVPMRRVHQGAALRQRRLRSRFGLTVRALAAGTGAGHHTGRQGHLAARRRRQGSPHRHGVRRAAAAQHSSSLAVCGVDTRVALQQLVSEPRPGVCRLECRRCLQPSARAGSSLVAEEARSRVAWSHDGLLLPPRPVPSTGSAMRVTGAPHP